MIVEREAKMQQTEPARLVVPDQMLATARMKIEQAGWAVSYYAKFDRPAVTRIARAVAEAAHENARFYADWAVRETGFGVAEHKQQKNELSALPLLDFYRISTWSTRASTKRARWSSCRSQPGWSWR